MGCLSPTQTTYLMVFRKYFARLGGCIADAEEPEGIDPPVPPRPQSQFATRSSEPNPQTLQTPNTGGEQTSNPFGSNLSLWFDLGTTGAATSEIPSASDPHLSVSNSNVSDNRLPIPSVHESKPAELSFHVVVTDGNKSNLKSTVTATAGLVIDILKESSDAFTPLKSMVGGLSAILKHYDVRYTHLSKPFAPFTFEPASYGEPWIDRIVDTPG